MCSNTLQLQEAKNIKIPPRSAAPKNSTVAVHQLLTFLLKTGDWMCCPRLRRSSAMEWPVPTLARAVCEGGAG